MAYKGNRINPRRFDKGQLKILLAVLPVVLLMGIPLIFLFCHALKPAEELFAFPPQLFVKRPTFENFTKLFKATRTAGIPVARYLFNSIIVTLSVVVSSVIFATASGFALSKLRFKGRKTLDTVNQIALMFVPIAVAIPKYLVINQLHMVDTMWAHILPAIPLPVALFLVRQFIDQVPDSLIDAAYIDGASDFRVYRSIILPLIKPATATAAILVFQQVWVDMATSNYYINSEGLKTLAFYFNTFANANNTVAGQGMAAAAALILMLPNLILFLILQGSIMNTMAHSGIK